MDPVFIKAFVGSIQNVFATMLQLPVTIDPPRVKDSPAGTYDISGIIGISGDVVGSVVLSFPRETACRVVALFTGSEIDPGHPDFADAIGELVNMISGGAKANFGGARTSISCPSVISGPGHVVATAKDTPCIAFPCRTDCGELLVEVAIKRLQTAAQPSVPAAIPA